MQGIHDLGGMDGFTLPERDQGRVLSEEWERQVWGLLFGLRIPGVSVGVRDLERIPPAEYLNMPYYARWLWAQERALLESGVVTDEELQNPAGPITIPDIPNFQPASPEGVLALLATDTSAELDEDVTARFSVGDEVIANDEYPVGITRMPGYVRGRRGVIYKDHGVHPFQDTLPPGEERRLQHLYSVRFAGSELWGSRGHPNDSVYVELWGDHLEPAD
jgi:nitrile hydratase beta subunit